MSRERPKSRPGGLPSLDETRVDWTPGERLMLDYIYSVFDQLAQAETDSDIRIPRELAGELLRAFTAILERVEPREALRLKPGRKRTDLRDYRKQRFVAEKVRELVKPYGKLNPEAAYKQVADELTNKDLVEVETRTVANWYKKFFDSEK